MIRDDTGNRAFHLLWLDVVVGLQYGFNTTKAKWEATEDNYLYS